LGLDKWMKPEESKTTKSKKKIEGKPKVKTDSKKGAKESSELTKYILICSNSKCKYKKTIVTKTLKEKDKICPRCKKEMKIK
jgi:hypothetical protein